VVVVAETVWEIWREREAEFKKPSIALLLTADAPSEAALSALAEATSEVMERRLAMAEAAGPGETEFRVGYCSFARVPQGVVLRVDEGPDDFEGLLQGVAEGLRARGIKGELDLYEPEGVSEIPERVDLFECYLRLNGEAVVSQRTSKRNWKPDPEALASAAEAGIAWCRGNDPHLPLALVVSLLPPVALDAEDDVDSYLREAIAGTSMAGGGVVHLTSATPDRFRTFAITAQTGRVGLIEGGASAKEDWRTPVRHLTGAMRSAAPWTVYCFLKRGSLRNKAVLGASLPGDWIEIPHMDALGNPRDALEAQFVPDAFGVQLLSPGHHERIPESPDWRIEPLASGRVLVEHTDPAAWFDGNLVRFGGHPNPFFDPYPPTPLFVTRAREDFDAILYKDGRPPAYAKELGRRRFLEG
jgi:hypothetical protein